MFWENNDLSELKCGFWVWDKSADKVGKIQHIGEEKVRLSRPSSRYAWTGLNVVEVWEAYIWEIEAVPEDKRLQVFVEAL